jgi:hypothetical protein
MGCSSFVPPKLAGYQVFETDHFVRFQHNNANSIPDQHQGEKIVVKAAFSVSKRGKINEKIGTYLVPSNQPPFSPGCTF